MAEADPFETELAGLFADAPPVEEPERFARRVDAAIDRYVDVRRRVMLIVYAIAAAIGAAVLVGTPLLSWAGALSAGLTADISGAGGVAMQYISLGVFGAVLACVAAGGVMISRDERGGFAWS